MSDWWIWVSWAVGLLGASLAIKGTIKFDVNEWLKERLRQKEENLRLLCPHARFTKENGGTGVHVAYVSPSGTLAWQCQMCGRVTHDSREVEQVGKYWAANPQALLTGISRERSSQRSWDVFDADDPVFLLHIELLREAFGSHSGRSRRARRRRDVIRRPSPYSQAGTQLIPAHSA